MIFCSRITGCLLLCLALLLVSCAGAPTQNTRAGGEQDTMHSPYDDSTLHRNLIPVLMPYNRIISPAGRVVTYGNPGMENHSLDVQLVPQTSTLAVEDRYGIALLDTVSRAVVARWSYADDAHYKGWMSTYSGLKVARQDGETHLFWSAANGQNHQSGVLEGVYANGRIVLKKIYSFAAVSSPLALPNEVVLTNEGGRHYPYVVLNGNN